MFPGPAGRAAFDAARALARLCLGRHEHRLDGDHPGEVHRDRDADAPCGVERLRHEGGRGRRGATGADLQGRVVVPAGRGRGHGDPHRLSASHAVLAEPDALSLTQLT